MNKWLKHTLLITLCLITACKTEQSTDEYPVVIKKGEDKSITLALSKDKLTTADSVKLKITLTAPEDNSITPPEIKDKLGDFSITNRVEATPKLRDNQIVLESSYDLTPFLAGEYTIPALTAQFKSDNGVEDISSDPYNLAVTSLLEESDTELKDIFGFHKIRSKYFFHILFGILFTLLLIIALVTYYLKCPKKIIIPPTPQELAIKALTALKAEGLSEKGEFKLFYTKLSNILRSFIEHQFSLSAPERTTEEFLPEIENNPIFQNAQRKLLQDFMRQSDLVKFAKYIPENNVAEQAYQICYEFILSACPKTEDETNLDNNNKESMK